MRVVPANLETTGKTMLTLTTLSSNVAIKIPLKAFKITT